MKNMKIPKINKNLRNKLVIFSSLALLLSMGCGYVYSQYHLALFFICIPISIFALYGAWTYSHLISRKLNLFSADMETVSREKGFTQFAKDVDDPDQLVARATPEEVDAVMRHTTGYKFGIPLLSKPATDYIMGKRLVRQTYFNDHLAIPVIGFVGDVGSGKTMGMVEASMKFRAQGYRIIGNDEGLGADYVFESLEELYEMMDMSIARLYKEGNDDTSHSYTLILFDEIQNTFDSRDFKNFDPRFWARVTQRRKYRWHLMWTAPKEEYVDIRVRQSTKWIWHCSITPFLKRYKRECFPPMEETTIGERPRAVTKTWLRQNVLEEYNTYAFINSMSKKGDSIKSQIIGQTQKLGEKDEKPSD